MKPGIKGIIEGLLEDSISSSAVVLALVSNVKIIANESKRLAEFLMQLNDRIEQHEKIILQICDLQKSKDKPTSAFDYPQKNKETPKPN